MVRPERLFLLLNRSSALVHCHTLVGVTVNTHDGVDSNERYGTSLEDFVGLLGLLTSSPPPETIVRALAQRFLKPFEVERASLHITSRCGRYIRMIADYGYPSGTTARFVSVDVTIDLPVTEALHRTSVLVLEPACLPERYPALRPTDESSDTSDLGTADQTWLFNPIALQGRVAGVLALLARRDALEEHRRLMALQGVTYALSLWLQRVWELAPAIATDEETQAVYPLTFTERQIQILRLVSEGLTNSQIAERLQCSRSTVKQELHRTMRSLDVEDRAAAAQRARELRLLETHP
mgnify:CR=1 FL=1